MIGQAEFDWDAPPPSKRKKTIQDQFEEFHKLHPEVWTLLVHFANELRAAGRRKYSARTIIHRIRWHYDVNPGRDGGFKINNNFSSRYSRKLSEEDPGNFAGFFEIRKLKAQ